MKDTTILAVINRALMILEKETEFAQSTLEVVTSYSFNPIVDFFKSKKETYYREELIQELENHYRKNVRNGVITRNTYNRRIRGIRMVREVYETGTFSWKGSARKNEAKLPEHFERIIDGVNSPECSGNKNRNQKSIILRFLRFLDELGVCDICQVTAEHIQTFLKYISITRKKSMHEVISSLRTLDRYLKSSGLSGLPYAGLLIAPRARERKVYPCMSEEELNVVIRSIDRSTSIGKRDYAILLLAAGTGMRSGDIAHIKLSDIDWRKKEIHIVQRKTHRPLNLPLQKGVGAALADYILNGRPGSKSVQVFVRNMAPFQRFKGGFSVACVLRRRMKDAGSSHKAGDGKTMHGIRRMLGTRMTVEGVPLATVAQVLGQRDIDTTRPYISLNVEGLRECALGFDSLLGGSK